MESLYAFTVLIHIIFFSSFAASIFHTKTRVSYCVSIHGNESHTKFCNERYTKVDTLFPSALYNLHARQGDAQIYLVCTAEWQNGAGNWRAAAKHA